MSSSMTPSDRETLSALFDGELDGDAVRFAMRRLDHDADWRDTCSRWQLAGDVLRGHGVGLAPAGFAQRVSAALAREADEGAAAVAVVGGGELLRSARSTTQVQPGRWWGRAALAASVAVAALFITHPFSGLEPGDGVPGTEQAPLAAIPAAAGALSAEDGSLPADPAATDLAAAAVAVAAVPRRATERMARQHEANASLARAPRRNQAPMMATRVPGVSPSRATVPTDASVGAVAAIAAAPASDSDPFGSAMGSELVVRPWPRAALPAQGASGAFTASFGTAPAAPSFYPFEPDPARIPQPASQSSSPPKPQP